MRTLDLAVALYHHYGTIEEINNYYGLLARYALVQAASELRSPALLDECREMLELYPDQVKHPHYNFDCYRLGGNAAAWAAMTGLQSRRPGELERFADLTLTAPKSQDGLLCMPGREAEGWIWIDTAAAVVPFMLFAGLTCRREEYIDFAARQCFGLTDALTDPLCGLLHQCRGFLGDPLRCSQDHWSRGNGWGIMALAELVRYLPQESPHRAKALRSFRELASALAPWQGPRGLWRQELTEPSAWEESSGTALILYALGIGLRTGILDRDRFSPVFNRGLEGLLRHCINGDFSTELSCPGCLCPGKGAGKGTIHAYITEKQPQHDEHHSFGTFMLALTEAHRNGIVELDFSLKVRKVPLNPNAHLRCI